MACIHLMPIVSIFVLIIYNAQFEQKLHMNCKIVYFILLKENVSKVLQTIWLHLLACNVSSNIHFRGLQINHKLENLIKNYIRRVLWYKGCSSLYVLSSAGLYTLSVKQISEIKSVTILTGKKLLFTNNYFW